MLGHGLMLALALLQFDAAPVPKTKQWVVYAAEQLTVPAGKRAVLELRFHVVDGFHVNSHTPKSELLIATKVEFGAADGVKLLDPEYPAGKAYSPVFDPAEKLDVYSDDFVVKVPVVAGAGEHELKGTLRYQACDKAACYPPKALPVDVLFTAK
jgi:hypothetical protein